MSCFLTQFSCGTTQSHQFGIMTIIAECFLLCSVLLVFVHVWYIMRSFLMFSIFARVFFALCNGKNKKMPLSVYYVWLARLEFYLLCYWRIFLPSPAYEVERSSYVHLFLKLYYLTHIKLPFQKLNSYCRTYS